jgi:hypothetical protein
MDIFPCMCHTFRTEYPVNGTSVELGGGYTFVATPSSPDVRVFVLKFRGMKYYTNNDGTLDAVTNASSSNFLTLENFYQSVRLHKSFVYPHPIYGNVVCRFKSPLKTPEGIPGGLGVLEEFDISLTEVV